MKNKITFVAIVLIFILTFALVPFICKKFYLYPVDLVYTWVDGNDENWLKEKRYWQEKYKINDSYAAGSSRFRDRGELLHSLRSVEECLPWVRKIYIVTYKQVPKWLNTNHPKIKIIDHSEIFPPDALPVFNSYAIENVIANIPNLSEHFIYSNDDFFVNKPLSKDFFFNQQGNPKMYTDYEYNKIYSKALKNNPNTIFAQLNRTFYTVFQNKLRVSKNEMIKVGNTHNMQGYLKSTMVKSFKIFPEELKRSTYSKFRTGTDINILNIALADDYINGRLEVLDAKENMEKYDCKIAGVLVMESFEYMNKFPPCLFCLNDYQSITQAVEKSHIDYLKKRFPNKSSFEK